MKTKAISSLIALSLISLQVSAASQCITPIVAAEPTGGKQVEVFISQDDHPHFKDASRKCSYYLQNYYAPGFKAAGLPIPTQAQCLADPSLIDLSKGFAPFGAFFRIKTSIPDSSIKNYQWVISGPSGDLVKYDAFNAAYVFEKEGTYTAKLTVTLNNGATVSDQKTVTVWPRNGKTYYVDSSLGDDRYNGLSQTPDFSCDRVSRPIGTCSGPWKTATRGFGTLAPRNWVSQSISDSKYSSANVCATASALPVTANGKTTTVTSCDMLRGNQVPIVRAGDTVAFNRGQTFEFETSMIVTDSATKKPGCMPLISTNHWAPSQGLLFTAYGSGAKPKIVNTAEASCVAFGIPGVGMMHLAFQDLDFNLENSSKADPFRPLVENRAVLLNSSAFPLNLVFNRVDVSKFQQGVVIDNPHGEFIKDSTFTDSQVTHLFSSQGLDVAILNNKFDYSGNHLLYTNMSNGLVVGNKFRRQAFGRTQFRIFGSNPANFVTRSVWISDNDFEGWIDPRTSARCQIISVGAGCPFVDGKRYNFDLVELNPNTDALLFNDRIVFTRNTLKNAETLLKASTNAHLQITNNIFDNLDGSGSTRLLFHTSPAAKRPLNDVILKNNLFTERSANRPANSSVMHINTYTAPSPACDDLPAHKDVNVSDNQLSSVNPACFISSSSLTDTTAQCLLNATQTGSGGTLGTITGLTLSSNKISSSTSSSAIDQTVASKSVEIKTQATAPTASTTPTTIAAPTNAKKATVTNTKKTIIKIAPIKK